MFKSQVIVCVVNFLIAALMGLALRFTFLENIGINYRFLTHAHSHTAMLGWACLMLFTLVAHYFLPHKKVIYNRLFWVTELAVIGMILSFPFQGYAVVSIFFSTLHIFCSYYFAYLVFKHHKTNSKAIAYLLKVSLLFMLLSTLGVWCLGPAVGLLGQASAFYQISIQFFLHFQFNGWFLIGVITVLFHLLKIEYSALFCNFLKLLVVSTILNFAFTLNSLVPYKILLYINVIAVFLQVISLFMFVKLVKTKLMLLLKNQSKLVIYLYAFSLFCFVLKTLLQTLSILPEVSKMVYNQHNFIIGFIHLMMLGIISGFLFIFIINEKLIQHTKSLYFGVYSFVIGFVLTEIILIIQACKFYFASGFIPNYYLILFVFSILLPLGVFFILFNIIKTNYHEIKTSKTT